MKKLLIFLLTGLISFQSFADKKNKKDTTGAAQMEQLNTMLKFADSVQKALKYDTGFIELPDKIASLNVPKGFKFLNAKQSNFILTEVWGNPIQTGVQGMLFPSYGGPFEDSSYAFVVTFEEMGFVKDKDADKTNYDDMLKELKKDQIETNAQRAKQGYPAINIIGWASKPYYDKEKKVLHWAKEIAFAGEEENTLNYDVRLLGRKGVLSMNAVANISNLTLVKNDIDKVLNMASFTEGNAYKDFDSKTDNVAAWTVGSLVAGKVLLKVGFFAKFLKFGKFILIGLVALWGIFKGLFKGKKKDESTEYNYSENIEPEVTTETEVIEAPEIENEIKESETEIKKSSTNIDDLLK